MKTLSAKTAFLFVTVSTSLWWSGYSFSPTGTTKAASRARSLTSAPERKPTLSSSSALSQSVTSTNGGGAASYTRVDWSALAKYSVGIAGQMSLIFGFFTGLDRVVTRLSITVPFWVNVLFLYAFNLQTSLFSLLPNKKSEQRKLKQESWEYNKRNKPSWTPPGFVFAIMWPLVTFGLRAVAGAMVIQSTGGRYASPAIMSLMVHLGIANLWNTVNNVERRLGVSVILLYALWLSKVFAAFQFYKVNPLAGKLLMLTLPWLTAAAALETRTWQINLDADTGKKEPLVPMQHPKWHTKFRWE